MMKKENQPNQIKYSIWDTKTEEDVDLTKEKLTEVLEDSSKTTVQRD